MTTDEPWIWTIGDLYGMGDDRFVALPRRTVEEVGQWLEIFECTTWGEVRNVLTDKQYAFLLELAGYGDFETFAAHLDIGRPIPGSRRVALEMWVEIDGLPESDDSFRAWDVPCIADGDFPPDIRAALYQEFVGTDLYELGERYETTINGTWMYFEADVAEQVVEGVRELGIEIERDDEALERIMWGLA